MNPFNHPYPGTPGQPQQFASYPGYPQSFPVYPQQFIPTYPAVPTPYPAYPSQQFLPQPPQLHQHPTLQLGTWPPFPLTYRDLFGFSMPEPAADRTNTTTTAPWSGSDPPQYPLCYSYRDQTIIPRALQGLHSYIERKQWWNKPTPAEAAMLWANLEVQYQTGEYEKELWLAPVMTILQMIVKALMHDLELAYSVSEVIPRLQHRQVGDIDWAVFTQHTPARTLTSVLLDQLHLPPRIPIVGPGSAIEQKVTGVLENYRTFFSQPFQLFLPPGPHVQGHAIVFKASTILFWLTIVLKS
ncbi:hypothetical protein DFH07DRAFT_951752 [Mycena maculata]|uniref:Uncharacterized protein n=1 Tax=Mycena maculata TaxID=230809 RepID=A0AAD7K1V7_9AGAR|nr:hypothetical protein DFH07DRAFT_951752 [Mycena maculata]